MDAETLLADNCALFSAETMKSLAPPKESSKWKEEAVRAVHLDEFLDWLESKGFEMEVELVNLYDKDTRVHVEISW